MPLPERTLPSRALLQSIASFLNRETANRPDVWLQVNGNATGIEFHYKIGSDVHVIDAPVWMVADEINIKLPRRQIAYFKKDLLDPTNPIWNN